MGKLIVKIEGLNFNRFLNELHEQGIVLFNTQRTDYNFFIAEVEYKDFKKFKSIAKKFRLKIELCGGKGVLFFLKQNWYRFGLLVGLVVCVVACSILTSFYWKINIKVNTNNEEITRQIQQYLSKNNLNVGTKIGDLKTRELEKKLVQNIDGCSSVVVERNGVELNVYVKQAVERKSLSETDIKASFSGVIKDIKVASGLLLVNIGDSVVAGQPLIVSDKVGDVFMEAQGSVVANVRVSGSTVGSTETKSQKRTGKAVEVGYIDVFGKKLYSSSITESEAEKKFELFDKEMHESNLSKNNLLPIKKYVITYYEMAQTCDIIPYDQLIETLKKSAYNIAYSKLPANAPIIDVNYDILEQNGLYTVICNIETQIDIAKRGE